MVVRILGALRFKNGAVFPIGVFRLPFIYDLLAHVLLKVKHTLLKGQSSLCFRQKSEGK